MQTRRFFGIAAIVLLASMCPTATYADCTLEESGVNQATAGAPVMTGVVMQYVVTQASTLLSYQTAPCNDGVQSEAWVDPGGTPVVTTGGAGWVQANAYVTGYVYGYWTGGTKNWYFYQNNNERQYVLKGIGFPSVDLGPDPVTVCTESGGWWDTSMDPPGCAYSPILINLRAATSDGDHLTSAEHGVWFDINATGQPKRVAWTKRNDDVAFLVLDRNGNGVIDDGTELFGTATVRSDGTRALNGFDALLDL